MFSEEEEPVPAAGRGPGYLWVSTFERGTLKVSTERRTSLKLVQATAASLESVYYWVSGHLGEKERSPAKLHTKGIERDKSRDGETALQVMSATKSDT